MRDKRMGVLFSMVAVSALGLAACSSDGDSGGGDGSAIGVECVDGTIEAGGSSAQDNAMQEWVAEYQTACPGSTINYKSIGSGAGIQQFVSGTTLFAGSDSTLDEAEYGQAQERCEGNPAWHLPMVIGPIAVSYNLPGVEELNLSPQTLAKIYSDEIKNWNDPAIQADNEGAELPDKAIQAFHRSDDSGTTDNFVKYLEGASDGAWTFGTGKTWRAPGGQGAKGNEGVSAGVSQTEGSIGYMEWSFAENNALSISKLGGAELTDETVGVAVDAAKVTGSGNDLTVELDYTLTGEDVYSTVLVSYEIVCSGGNDPAKMELMQSFLSYTASDDGQDLITSLKYAPLPPELAESVRTAVGEIAIS